MPPSKTPQKPIISDVMRPARRMQPVVAREPSAPRQNQPQPSVHSFAPPPRKLANFDNKPNWILWVQIAAIVLVVMVVGFWLKLLPLGQLAIVSYGVVALIKRIESGTSFKLGLVALALALPLALLGQRLLAENFAAYAFLLLVIAVMGAFLETFRQKPVEKNAVYTTLEKANGKNIH